MKKCVYCATKQTFKGNADRQERKLSWQKKCCNLSLSTYSMPVQGVRKNALQASVRSLSVPLSPVFMCHKASCRFSPLPRPKKKYPEPSTRSKIDPAICAEKNETTQLGLGETGNRCVGRAGLIGPRTAYLIEWSTPRHLAATLQTRLGGIYRLLLQYRLLLCTWSLYRVTKHGSARIIFNSLTQQHAYTRISNCVNNEYIGTEYSNCCCTQGATWAAPGFLR